MNIDSLFIPCVLIIYLSIVFSRIEFTDVWNSHQRARGAFLFAVAIQYLAGQGVGALPVPNLDRRSTSSSDQPHFRTTWNIVSSCVAIIFSCIWVALHPNIPSPGDSPLRIALRRAKLMVMALIAPELIVLWAMRQWLVSRRLADKYRGVFHFLL